VEFLPKLFEKLKFLKIRRNMYKNHTIAVIVPAYNEEKLVGKVIETIPDFVDRIIVVDDGSTDGTKSVVEKCLKESKRMVLISHQKNQGVGAAIITGYKWFLEHNLDVAAVMAGDAQMDPSNLPSILDAIIEGKADYVKGNRLFTGEAWKKIPHLRYLGNSILSLLSKVASGYWHVADYQCGYTAINKKTLHLLDLDKVHKRYGMPNDFLVRLNVIEAIVADVPVKPVYNIGEKSGIKYTRIIPKLSWMLWRLFLWRLRQKYIIRDFHPLVFFYFLGFFTFPAGLIFGLYLFFSRIFVGPVAPTSTILAIFLVISGLQSLFFAMWFDMEKNKDLKNKSERK
jgi:glycosyltransferase involved in cell wall biosynthesis